MSPVAERCAGDNVELAIAIKLLYYCVSYRFILLIINVSWLTKSAFYWNVYRKANLDLKKKQYRNGQKLWLKVETDQEQWEKAIIELKGNTARFHKSRIKFSAKAVSQQKK